MNLRQCLLVAVSVNAGCVDTGQELTTIPLLVAGSDVSEPFEAVGSVPVTLDRADLAFGPLYLCAGVTAGELCDTARLEWIDTTVVDTANPDPVRAGELVGATGPVRSWMYDLGISSQFTRDDPFVLDAAKQLGDVSFVVEGHVDLDGSDVSFAARIAIQQNETTELGVPVIRKASGERFFHDVTETDASLLLRFDPRDWLRPLDFRTLLSAEACGTECNELTIVPETEAHRSLTVALTTTGRPEFEWSRSQ